MIVRLNVALRNLILNCIFNGGIPSAMFDGGTAEFRSAVPPATADDPAPGIVVALVALPADAMDLAAGGTIAKNPASWQDLAADNAGTMLMVRFKSADTTLVMDMDVTNALGVGAVKVDNPTLVAGQQFQVLVASLTMPASTP